jgi:hypothetical protein
MFKKGTGRVFLLLIGVAILMGVGSMLLGVGDPDTDPPAGDLLPSLPGYNVVEGQELTGYIGKLSGGAALLAGQPELAAAIAVVDQIVGCYQDVGAAQARLYSDQEAPLSAGAVAIADRNALIDPQNLFKCVAPMIPDGAQDQAGAPAINPCTASYTLERDDNEFYIVYAGTTEEICRAFCAALEGCTAHR